MASYNDVALSTSLNPLPKNLYRPLLAVAFFGLLSLTTSVGLFLLLSYRLFSWYRNGQLRNGTSQFLILFYNLLLADIQQAVAFALTTVYVATNEIDVGTTTCWANGWFISTGDLASSVFILTIALHTFFAAVKGRNVTDRLFYAWIAAAWTFVYVMAIITVTVHGNVYARAGAWCWIDKQYQSERLWLHYIWIFISMFGTVIIYSIIYVSIGSKAAFTNLHSEPNQNATRSSKRAARFMIIYPAVYVICTLPLAGGRMAAMRGLEIPYWWYCLSGAAITSCGWIDVLLYAFTRRAFVFSKAPPPRSAHGLNTFGWYHDNDFYGHSTTVEGPLTHRKTASSGRGLRTGSLIEGSMLRPLRKKQSDEDYFAAPPAEGVITTKTTVEVTSGPLPGYAGSELSIIELDKSLSMETSRSP